jgi:hypothetical protein
VIRPWAVASIAGLNRFVWALEEQVPRTPRRRVYDQERA